MVNEDNLSLACHKMLIVAAEQKLDHVDLMTVLSHLILCCFADKKSSKKEVREVLNCLLKDYDSVLKEAKDLERELSERE